MALCSESLLTSSVVGARLHLASGRNDEIDYLKVNLSVISNKLETTNVHIHFFQFTGPNFCLC